MSYDAWKTRSDADSWDIEEDEGGEEESVMLPRKKWHKSVTTDALMAAMERLHRSVDNPGFCLACGLEIEGVEPDAQAYKCESCGEPQVYGVEELYMETMGE